MLLDAATGKDQYEDWDGKYDPDEETITNDWDYEQPYGDVPW
ncbi:uncharacterized protein METZ01_LOCUS95622 [marine metagenome]|uniref:Uncharacterized protein n=1 Tax=marine metagenome TaxID=408172 RepID=A0A381VSQ0_9ZZZZ